MAGWMHKTFAVASLFLLFVPWMHFWDALWVDHGPPVGMVLAAGLVLTLSAVAIDFGVRTAARPGATALDVGEGAIFVVGTLLLSIYQYVVWLGVWAGYVTGSLP